jgi:peptidoglycan/xylan/chitin deacetylase (PgdA/CDA1 family)
MAALMYHDIVEERDADTSGFPGPDAALYKISPSRFEAHLRAIRRTPAVLAAGTPPVFTFDDGGVSAIGAADALERNGFIGNFFITVNYIGARGFLGQRDIQELSNRGHVIGSHSCSHPLRIGHCGWPQLLDEWTRSCDALADIIGGAVTAASVPGGDFAPQVAESAARAGFTTLFTSEPTLDASYAFGLTLRGRFTIRRRTSAATAAALASGEWLPCARQGVLWNAKKMSKRLGGERYLQLRRLLLGHDAQARWGDSR